MNDEYLWDKQGRDPEVEKLEELLEPLAHGRRPKLSPPAPRARRGGVVLAVLAAAAAVAVIARPWTWRPGTRPEPTAIARAIDLEEYGSVEVHPGAVVEVVRQTDDDIRLRLERGTIEARITLAARPRLFQVETPATTCVDLGCQYTLTVEDDGSTLVRVALGQVAFVDGGRETWIPADASCRAWPARGSGTPRWNDAGADLCAAIERLDRAEPAARASAAQAVIALCDEEREALTLWHLTHEQDAEVAEAACAALIALRGTDAPLADPRAPEAAEDWKHYLEDAGRAE